MVSEDADILVSLRVTTKNFNIYDPLSQGKALVLDGQTLAHIEVLQNSLGGQEGTLLQLLMRCVTPFGELPAHIRGHCPDPSISAGKRLFKVWLCTPLREVSAINDRSVEPDSGQWPARLT